LFLENGTSDACDIDDGGLVSADGQQRSPLLKGIPSFVPKSNYADNFNMQWKYFRQMQLDSHPGQIISTERFGLATEWCVEHLKDQWVLHAGCGTGRFAEVALLAGAKVVAMDYSSAVDACYSNLKHHSNLHVIQAYIFALPFAHQSVQFVYLLGVLQHKPNVAKAFVALPPMVRLGEICVQTFTGVES
jgi:2-polyprenyl-3-methyl-5-hydroxy-6-metoxy-1,4-benzoquinol methylase